jgi:uncharacterized protein YceK
MKTLIATLASLTLLCSGCGTVVAHDDKGQGDTGGVTHGVYRGVRTDWQWIAHAEPETSLGAPLWCIDMPFSFVFDTLLLPFDAMGITTGTTQVK